MGEYLLYDVRALDTSDSLDSVAAFPGDVDVYIWYQSKMDNFTAKKQVQRTIVPITKTNLRFNSLPPSFKQL